MTGSKRSPDPRSLEELSRCRTPTPVIAARLREMAVARPLALVSPPTARAEPLDLSRFGAAVRCLRHRVGLTQSEVGRRAGVTKAMVSGYETAGRLPSVRTLARLLGALEADFGDLQEAMEAAGEKRSGGDRVARGAAAAPLTPPADSPWPPAPMPDRWIPLDPDRPLPDRLDLCRARFLDLADRLRAFEEQARAELRALAEMLGEPPDYDAMCEHQKPVTAWGELYRTASALADDWESLDNDYAGFLNSAAAATDASLLAEWRDGR